MYYTNPDTKFLLKNQALLFAQITCIHNIYNNMSVISKMANRIWRWEVFLPSLIRILKNRQKWQNGHFRRMRVYKGKTVGEYKTITVKLSTVVVHTVNLSTWGRGRWVSVKSKAILVDTMSPGQPELQRPYLKDKKQTPTHKTTTQQTGKWRNGQVGGDIHLKES